MTTITIEQDETGRYHLWVESSRGVVLAHRSSLVESDIYGSLEYLLNKYAGKVKTPPITDRLAGERIA
jgi:hypothetical protein